MISLAGQRILVTGASRGIGRATALAWVDRVDEPNALLVEASAHRADRLLDLSGWQGHRHPVVLPDPDTSPQPFEGRG